MLPPTATNGRRRMGPQPLHADQHHERRHGHRQRDQRGLGNVLDEAQDIGEEPMLGDVDAEEASATGPERSQGRSPP